MGLNLTGAIRNSYSIGPVNGSGTLGGLIGSALSSAVRTLVSSYWNIETSGQLASAAGSGQNTLQLVTPISATGSIYELWTAESTALPGEPLWDFGDNRQYAGLRLPLSTDDCTVSATTPLCPHRPATPRFAEFVETSLTVVEGNTVAVDVTLSYPSTEPVTVSVTSLGAAHIATSGAVTIPAGATTGTVLLATFGNRNNTVDNEVQVSLAMSDVAGSGLGYVIGVNSRATITVRANRPPVITSRSFSVDENSTAVGMVIATDREDAITGYAITGVDEASFAISTTGALTFNTAPDFENPQGGSANNSNTYELVVMVSSGIGIHERAASQAITVTVTDLVDEDGDGLIEIHTLTQLNNIRYNLAGTARTTTSAAPGSTAGCPGSRCSGYELVRSLDFNDANNDGTDDDAYDTDLDTTNGNWAPIGSSNNGFNGTFEGNGNTIANMSVAITDAPIGLFGAIDVGAVIRYVGLVGASVRAGANSAHAGGLVGQNDGTISGSYVIGSVSGAIVGGLVGQNDGTISGSYVTGSVSGAIVGGLVGQNDGTIRSSYVTGSVSGAIVGGLVGLNNGGTIRSSYVTGSVGGETVGGLVGVNAGDIENSYWNIETSGQLASADGEGRTTLQLVTQTAATGSIYEFWTAGSAVLPGEPLWDFEDNRQYPGLRLPLSTDDCTVGATTPLCTHRPVAPRFADFVETALAVVEGNTVAVNVKLSYTSTEPVTVSVTSLGAAHIATSGAVTIPAGATTGTVLLATFVNRNNTVDNEVEVFLAMSDVVGSGLGYVIGVNSRATITVLANRPPVITSRSFSVGENTTAVGTVVATDAEDAITGYAITGVDEASFAISTTGALTFNIAPDFENPQGGSANNSNTYELMVMVSSGIGIHERAASQVITGYGNGPS